MRCQGTAESGKQCENDARQGRASCAAHNDFDYNHFLMSTDPDIAPFLAGPPMFDGGK